MYNQINTLHDEIDPVDFSIRYDVGKYGFTNFRDISKIVDVGYREAKKNRKDILRLLKV